jgi:hypothetical protein
MDDGGLLAKVHETLACLVISPREFYQWKKKLPPGAVRRNSECLIGIFSPEGKSSKG